LTQACDLAQTKTTKVLAALLQPAQFLVERGVLKAATLREQVRRGLVYVGISSLRPRPPSRCRNRSSISTTCTPYRAPFWNASSPTANAFAGYCRRIANTSRNILR
jgi:hypothetical protein